MWIVHQHFDLWFKHKKKWGNGNNESMACRTNCKRSRNKQSSYVSRLRPCNRTCSFWDIIWCATPVAMNGRHSTTEEHSNSHPQPERLLNLSPLNTTSAFCGAKSWILSKKASHKMRTKEVGNVPWKKQLGNVLWKAGHIPNSVCFHRSSLIKTSCSWLIWIITEQRWVINEQLSALLLSLNPYTQRVE